MKLLVYKWTGMLYIEISYYDFEIFFLASAIASIKGEPFPRLSKKVKYYLRTSSNPNGYFYFMYNHTIIWLYGFYEKATRPPFYTSSWIFEMEVIYYMDYIEMEWGVGAKKKTLYPHHLQFEFITTKKRNY